MHYFDGVSIVKQGNELCVEYSEPDQGGTLLKYRYFVPKAVPSGAELLIRSEIGYTFDKRPHRQTYLPIESLPERVCEDATIWLARQLEIARATGQDTTAVVLNDYITVLGRPSN